MGTRGGPLQDLTEQRFGRWLVLRRSSENGKAGQPRWLCRCDCGTERAVNGCTLRQGRSKSCGRCPLAQVGERFGRLVVITSAERNSSGHARWLCRCDCGAEIVAISAKLRAGHTRSCGCLKADLSAERNTTHGMSDHPMYGVWLSMKDRCQRPRNKHYRDYGGRGIYVCSRWESFENFLADVGTRPPDPPGWASRRSYWSLDRIDVDGPYAPENCRWATPEEQQSNKRPRRRSLRDVEARLQALVDQHTAADGSYVPIAVPELHAALSDYLAPLMREAA